MPEMRSRAFVRNLLLSGLVAYTGCTAQTTTLRPEGPAEAPTQPVSPVVAQAEPVAPSATPSPSAEAPSRQKGEQPSSEAPAAERPVTSGEVTPAAPIQITGLQVEQHGPSSVTVMITADGPASSYESFSLSDPPRIVIDIPNARRALSSRNGEWKAGPVAHVRITQYRERPVPTVRVVVDLREPLSYKLAVTGNQYKVSIGEAPPAAPVALPAAPAPEKKEEVPAAQQPEAGKVTKLEFQTPPGRSRVVISTVGRVTYNLAELSNPPRLLIDILDALIEPEAQQGLGPQQVTGPIERVRAAQYQRDPQKIVRVVTDLKHAVKYEVQQTAEGIVVDLVTPSVTAEAPQPAVPLTPSVEKPVAAAPVPSPVKAAPPRAPAPAPVPRPTAVVPQPVRGTGRLSMDFKDAEITNLLRIIAEVSGFNIVVSDEVKGKITVRLINVEWPQALNVILRTANLGYTQDGNIIRVASQASIQKEKEERARALTEEAKAQEAQVLLEPLVMRVLPVNYARADDMAKQLDRLKTKTRGTITPDGRTNTIIVEDVSIAIEKMEGLLKRLDVPTPQVFIEARIVEATRTFSRSLGIEYGFLGEVTSGSKLSPITIFSSATGTNITPPTTTIPLFLNFPAAGTNPAAIAATIGSIANSFTLGVRLSAAESENKVKTLSAPKIATLDNEEAEIKQGTQIPFTTVDSSGRTVISFTDAFIRLKVKPHITNDQRISMKVEAERSFPGDRIDFAGGFAFPVNTRKATTNILIPSGGTVVIGGLLQITERESETRVPFLAKIPVLGYLFKNNSLGPDDKAELLVFLTPRILQEPRVAQQRP